MGFIYWVHTAYNAVTFDKGLVRFVLDFILGFSPIFIWLVIFKSAGSIPIEWRPEINVKLTPIMEDVLFNPGSISSWLTFLLIVAFSTLTFFFHNHRLKTYSKVNDIELADCCIIDHQHDSSLLESDKCCSTSNSTTTSLVSPSPSSASLVVQTHLNPFTSSVPLIAIIAASWPALNILRTLSTSFLTTALDITAFISYVILHLAIPISTAVYLLYLVHPSGDLKRFSFNLGIQNILAVITHLTVPTAPPWFIHLNGINAHADYGTLGYAAGLIRVDTKLGTHISTNGFHKSPIVFGACPSVHSAMAVCCLLWISCQRKISVKSTGLKVVQIIARVIVALYVLLQWWATMYFDHHWRVDLFFGMIYSMFSFLIINLIYPADETSLSFGQRLFKNNRSAALSKLFY